VTLATCSVTALRDRTLFENKTTNYSEPRQWHLRLVMHGD
jgi:hypothetical protein